MNVQILVKYSLFGSWQVIYLKSNTGDNFEAVMKDHSERKKYFFFHDDERRKVCKKRILQK